MQTSGVFWLCLAFLAGCAGAPGRFEFALIGDQQYNAESEAQFPRLMDDVNRVDLAFVVHIGDFKAGTFMLCDDALFLSRRDQFDASRHPFIYTPGDNEWTDCHASRTGGFEPVERLSRLRELFFVDDQSLGRRRLKLERQSDDPRYTKFRENARWRVGPVLFATIHVVGSNNNLGRTPEQDAEYRERNAANLAWLKEIFAAAKRDGSSAVAIFMQANPRFEYWFPASRAAALETARLHERPSGFAEFVPALAHEVLAWGKPVAVLHGDTHYFRVDKPLFRTGEQSPADRDRQIEDFTRVEVHGFPGSHWVKVTVDPADPAIFTFRDVIVDANRFLRP